MILALQTRVTYSCLHQTRASSCVSRLSGSSGLFDLSDGETAEQTRLADLQLGHQKPTNNSPTPVSHLVIYICYFTCRFL